MPHTVGRDLPKNSESVNDLVARRLDPVRITADLAATLDGIDALERDGGATTFAVVAVTFNSCANAVAILDGAAHARRFIQRFDSEGIPSLWHAGAVVGVQVFGVVPEEAAALADVARGRWFKPAPDGSDRLVDPTIRPGVDTTGTHRRD